MSVVAAYRGFDVAVDALVRDVRSKGATIPCSNGCDACCYEPVALSNHEAAVIAERIHMDDYRRKRVSAHAAWLEAQGWVGDGVAPRAYLTERMPCPLLDVLTHQCVVYDVRPIACRAHILVDMDPAVCSNRALHPAIDTLKVDGPAVQALLQMRELGEMSVGPLSVMVAKQLEGMP